MTWTELALRNFHRRQADTAWIAAQEHRRRRRPLDAAEIQRRKIVGDKRRRAAISRAILQNLGRQP